jgi:Ca-activated chloride channel family protein
MRKTTFVVVGLLCLGIAGGLWAFRGARTPRAVAAPDRLAKVVDEPRMKQAEGAAGSQQQDVSNSPSGVSAPTAAPATGDRLMAKMAPPPEKVSGKKVASSKPSVTVQYGSGAASAPSLGMSGAIGIGGVGTKGRGGGLGMYGAGPGGGGTSSIGYGSGMGLGGAAPKQRTVTIIQGQPMVSGNKRVVRIDELEVSGEGYQNYGVNPFVDPKKDRLSTFAVDVDTASYTIARRKIVEGSLPPKDSVRVEEFLNYFHYSYAPPLEHPLAVAMDAAPSPLNPGRHLLRVGVQGKKLSVSERKPAHLTFLVDVSGSMHSPDKLPMVKRSLRLLVDNLKDGDTVALVTYAGGVKLVLPPTGLENKLAILSAIEELTPGGSTAMASGIELAYKQAMKTLDGKSVSRVLILSDGDANVGATSHEEILKQIRGYVKEGVTLSTFGFGMGNYKDQMMEQLADRGNGNYFYVDSLMQARRIFQEQLGGTLEVIAQDVKLQVEFDPAQVLRYRLVGYENRDVADEDFRNDKVDAGEIGAGHTVTALYELELAKDATGQGLATVRIRAKKPRGEKADEAAYEFPSTALSKRFEDASPDFRFATSVMAAAEIFRQSPHASAWKYEDVVKIAKGASPAGNAERQEFVALLERARDIVGKVASR